ncbi:MAG: cytochrome c [Chitinophagaceae bacterium]|nr:cytochrome c [Chitinophagaceae bacterium]
MKMIFVTFALSAFSITLLSFNQTFDLKASVKRGKTVYETNCMSCHMPEGTGLEGTFPPLAKSKNLADKNRMIKVILQGMKGPLKVNGVTYESQMVGVSLADKEVADVLNYIRNSWGNKYPAVLPKDIQPGLKAVSKGYQKF